MKNQGFISGIRNLRRRMISLPLGPLARKTAAVSAAVPAQARGGALARSVTARSRSRKRISVEQHLIIPAGAVVDQMPTGGKIPDAILSLKPIRAAIARGDIRIER